MTPSRHVWLGAALVVPSLATALYIVWLVGYPPEIRQTSYLTGKLLQFSFLAWAAVLASAGFTAHHVILLTAFFGTTSMTAYLLSATVFTGGLFWTWLYRRDGSLFGPWLSHALVDVAIFVIGYRLVF